MHLKKNFLLTFGSLMLSPLFFCILYCWKTQMIIPYQINPLILLYQSQPALNPKNPIQFQGSLYLSLFAIINMRAIYQTFLIEQRLNSYNSLIIRLQMPASKLKDRPFAISTVFSKHQLIQIDSPYTRQLHQLFTNLKEDGLTMDINPSKLQNAQGAIQKIQQKQKDREELHELAAKCFLMQENYEAAIRQYKKAWKFSPGNAIYGINIAICLMEAQNTYDAIKLLQKQSIHHPKNSAIYHHLAISNWMIENYHQAIRNFHISYKLIPEINDEFIKRGKHLLCEERYTEALPFYVKWVIHDRNEEEALEGLKDCFIKNGRLEDAIQFYSCLGEVEEYRLPANYSLALLSFESGNIKQAKVHLDHALRQNPDSFKLNLYLGIVFIQEGDNSKAVACLKKCLDINPNDANALTSLSLAYMRMNDFDKAYQFSLESVKANEKDSISWYTLGTILLQRNDVETGIRYLKKAIELEQHNYPALEKLASTLYLLGDEKQANSLVHKANKVKEDLSKS